MNETKIPQFKWPLGIKMRDRITRLEGILTGRCQWVTGVQHVLVAAIG